MILPIYIYGQPVLRKESADIEKDYPNLKELLANMFETMEEANGVGLAAPQIGLNIRVVVIQGIQEGIHQSTYHRIRRNEYGEPGGRMSLAAWHPGEGDTSYTHPCAVSRRRPQRAR